MNPTTTGPAGIDLGGQTPDRAGSGELDQAYSSAAVNDGIAQDAIEIAVSASGHEPATVPAAQPTSTPDQPRERGMVQRAPRQPPPDT